MMYRCTIRILQAQFSDPEMSTRSRKQKRCRADGWARPGGSQHLASVLTARAAAVVSSQANLKCPLPVTSLDVPDT